MSRGKRLVIAIGFVGGAALLAVALGDGAAGAAGAAEGGRAGAEDRRARKECRGGPGRGRVVHGELKVRAGDGFALVVTDAGEVTAVDAGAGTITLRRADGESVTARASDATRVCKDGHRSSLAEVSPGDLARIARVTRGGETTLRGITARSPGEASGGAPGPSADGAGPAAGLPVA